MALSGGWAAEGGFAERIGLNCGRVHTAEIGVSCIYEDKEVSFHFGPIAGMGRK